MSAPSRHRLRRPWLGVVAPLLGLLGSLGCASKGQAPKEQSARIEAPVSESISLSTRHYQPQQSAAKMYNPEFATPRSVSEEQRRWARWFEAQGLELKPGLSRVAHDALRVLQSSQRLVPALRDALMAWHGQLAVDVSFSRLKGEGDPESTIRRAGPMLLQALGSQGEDLELGMAVVRRGMAWEILVVHAQPRARVEPFAKRVALGDTITIRARLGPGRERPMMMVVDPGGQGQVIALHQDQGEFAGEFRCTRGRGRYQVEWVAHGPMGPEVVVNVPVYCGEPEPDSIAYQVESIDPDSSRQDLERASWELVNRVRQSQGLPALIWDPTLAQLARDHSAEMERLDYVGHRSPQRGSFDMRLDEAGIHAPLALENVASGFGPHEILDRLMASPGHRFNILHPKVTHLGVGVAIRTTLGPQRLDSLFLTQHFARWEQLRVHLGHQGRVKWSLGSP